MSIATRDAYITRRNSRGRNVFITKTPATTPIANRLLSLWTATGVSTGVAPTTAAVPDNTTAGSFGQLDSSGTQRILRTILGWSSNASGSVIIVDRLSHQGGLSGTTTGAQTTNLPTAALTRYTSGVGVIPALEIYTATGATATTVTASYTDDTGASGLATPTTVFGGTAFTEATRLIFLPLTGTSKGVRAVASVTLAATTGTAGNFGVTLFRPILAVVSTAWRELLDREALWALGTFEPVVNGACLFAAFHINSAVTSILSGELIFGED